MPRIRSLKPEHRQHRKLGPLDHVTYRLWVGMICEADDEGRLVADAEQLRVLIFGFRPEITALTVEESLGLLAKARLIRLYTAKSTRCVEFPSWKDHQRINRPTQSKLPPYKESQRSRTHGGLNEDSLSAHGGLTPDRRGSDLIGEEGIGEEGSVRGGEPSQVAPIEASNGHLPKPKPGEFEEAAEKLRREHPDWAEVRVARVALKGLAMN